MAKILVADDSLAELQIITQTLQSTGHSSVTVMDGEAAEAKAKSEKFDLIVLDVIMPKKNGFQVCREIKTYEQTKNIPAETLEWLYGKEDELCIELIGWDFIMSFIHSMETLGMVLKHLEKGEEGAALENIGWQRVLDCIQTPADLTNAFSGLTDENVRKLIGQLDAKKLRQLIPVRQELTRISKRYLTEKNARYLRERYDQMLSEGMA